jgi:hypothetical protein
VKAEADILPSGASATPNEPSLPAIVAIFWAAFAVAIVATRIMNPVLFESQDPDSFLRIVQVRDLLAGQAWFDLVQHRMDPPGGALLQWSRLIDAPLAFLVVVGNAVGLGENLATTLWPTLLLLGLMGAAAAIASALAGRAAAVATLILVLFFLDPLILYLPGDIDHHSAQIVVMMATLAFALRLSAGPLFGFLAGACSALTLAIGLEMLPHVAILGAAIALRFAWSGENSRAVAAYGAAIGVLPAVLYFLTGSPVETVACDALSYAFATPAFIAGAGLAALALLAGGQGRGVRVAGLLIVGAAAAGWFLGVTPECLGGPYGQLAPDVKAAFLDTVSEAQPIWAYAEREPVGAIGSVGPLLVALYVAFRHVRRAADWILPTALLVLAVALSFYQVRTLPFASALAIPVAGVWLAEVHARTKTRAGRMRRLIPVAAVFLAVIPYFYLLVGWGGEKALAALSDGRIAPIVQPKPDPALTKGLTTAEQNCFDSGAASLFAEVPRGLVLSPLFYGSTVLMLSDHSVVAGPYHRNGVAILDAIDAMHRPPAEAKAIVERRGVDYVVICAVAQESAIAAHKAPDGLLAELQAGRTPDWLEPVPAKEATKLRLWRVVKPTS